MPGSGPPPDSSGGFPGYRIGEVTLDLRRGVVRRNGEEVRLRLRSLDVLTCLARRPRQLVTKRELIEAVWADVAVTDDSLVQCLVEIRRLLGEASITTVRGRGYILECDVAPLEVASVGSSPALPADGPAEAEVFSAAGAARAASPVRQRRPATRLFVAGGLVTAAIVGSLAALTWPRTTPSAPPGAAAIVPATPDLAPEDLSRTSSVAAATAAYRECRLGFNTRTRDGLRRAVDRCEAAIALDPSFAAAYAGLSDSLTVLGVFGHGRPLDLYPRSRAAALRAIELDPTLADGHASLAHVRVQLEWDWTGAEAGYRRALALDPRHPRVHQLFAHMLVTQQRYDESLHHIRQALALRPDDVSPSGSYGLLLYLAGQQRLAIEQLERAQERQGPASMPSYWLAIVRADLGLDTEAMTTALASRQNLSLAPTWIVGYLHARAGRRADAAEVARALAAHAETTYVPATDHAFIALALGRRSEALTWLERGAEERARWIDLLATFPLFDPLRDEPRFRQLLARMGLPATPPPHARR